MSAIGAQRWIILDLGNVCVNVNPMAFPGALGETLENVNSQVWQMQEEFECGKMTEENFFEFVSEYFDGRHSIEKLKSAYCEIIQGEIPGMAEFVRARKVEGFAICMLSDTSEIHLKYAAKKLSFFSEFDELVLSYEVGCKKPHSAMYEAIEKTCGGKPLCFADDKMINIEGAQRHGWKALLFEGPKKFFEEFSRV